MMTDETPMTDTTYCNTALLRLAMACRDIEAIDKSLLDSYALEGIATLRDTLGRAMDEARQLSTDIEWCHATIRKAREREEESFEGQYRKVKNLMTGEIVEIPANTPRCCDPSTETYWSM